MTNEKRIEVLNRLVKEEEDRISFLESELSDEDADPVPAVEGCRDNIAVYTRMLSRLRQKP